ncbi:Gfo/Idh/MocA family protein [Deinococcus roseus]|uniref:Oxidoreductase n=1 Tax=Deinococcus roseus TaxID=392414 RepID=A0ABQ2CVT6_9DEIO|nr:Gfo/Idh/MocA family oxidoreductase [Deinococcus roseus]GGJ19175.1 oxidoreductase [Deinococcus roseus]
MNWGILGAARIAQSALVPAIREAGSTVHMVAARDPQKAHTFAEENQIPHSSSYQELLKNSDIEAVYVPLPNSEHLEWTIKALEAGKHVLCEKPLTLNASEARAMIEAQQKSGKLVLEAFSYRFHPQIERMLERLREGAIGEVRFLKVTYGFNLDRPDDIRWDPRLGGGAFYDVGCYGIDIMRLITREVPEQVHAVARMTTGGVDLDLGAMLHYSSCIGLLNCSFGLPFQQVFEVQGTRGNLILEAPFATDNYEAHLTVNGKAETFPKINPYAEMVKHFEKAIAGTEPLRFTLQQDSLPQMETLEQVLNAVDYPRT